MKVRRVILAAPADRAFTDRVASDPAFAIEDHSGSADLGSALRGASVLVTRSNNDISEQVLSQADSLELILQGTSGIDNIDLDAATRRNIEVVNVPGANANAVAEAVLGMIISLTRRLPSYSRQMREGRWTRSDCARLSELRSHPIGIVGLGRVGSRLARIVGTLGGTVSAYDPYVPPERFEELGVERCGTLEELLQKAAVVSFHVPLTDETDGMAGRGEIGMLPEGAVVINTSRGPVVELDAVLDALASGKLSGAWIDVFENEPPAREDWPDHPGLILTPHIAGCSREARDAIGEAMYRALVSHFA